MNGIFGELFAGAIVVLAVLFNGYVGYWVAGHWLSDRESKIAGFAFTFGGGLSGSLFKDFGNMWTTTGGAIIGLALLWRLFFRPEKQHG